MTHTPTKCRLLRLSFSMRPWATGLFYFIMSWFRRKDNVWQMSKLSHRWLFYHKRIRGGKVKVLARAAHAPVRAPCTATVVAAASTVTCRFNNIIYSYRFKNTTRSHGRRTLRACKFSAGFAAPLASTTRVCLQQALQLCCFQHLRLF